MDTVIRIGLVVIAIIAVIALLTPVLTQLGEGVTDVANALPGLITQLAPYLVFGRTLLNALIGYPVLVDVCLWLMLLAPLSVALVEFGIYIYSKLVG